MIRSFSFAALFALLAAFSCAGAQAQTQAEDAASVDDLPFTRSLAANGVVVGSLEESALEAGVPAAATAELLSALGETIDIARDVRDGDRFYVRYERRFTLEDQPIDDGRVLWAELQLSAKKTTVALHRFRPSGATQASLWLANGQAAALPQLRLPLASYILSSGFGLRVDPLDQPPMLALGAGGPKLLGKGPARGTVGPTVLPSGIGSAANGGVLPPVNVATPLGMSMGLAPDPLIIRPSGGRALGGSLGGVMALHEGVDLVAGYGTPIHAAGDGVVKGAEPKGRYGNWVQIDHPGDLSTVYGHLMSFAPGIEPGKEVSRGEVIGYIGLTGRTTGPHVHFEVRFKGRPVNPMVYSALKPQQLQGGDLARLRKVAARNLAEREGEIRVRSAGL
jgi:murein DD-endopeptidase MepM/ murein hydrolase activator NlpD